jgi:hypothetical protein
MFYELTTLPNGLRIITEDMPSSRSIAIGCWVDTGSRDEVGAEAGASHFLEHLLFKGSERLSAQQIAEAFDAVGAQHNAFTSKEYTCYWARMRDADAGIGIGILAEMLRSPAFRQEEIDSERHVVLEEINMNEDDPTDVAHEEFVRALWAGHPLSPPILGSRESILGMSRDTIAGYWGRRYSPRSTVIAAAGRVDHEELVALVTEVLGEWEAARWAGRSPSRGSLPRWRCGPRTPSRRTWSSVAPDCGATTSAGSPISWSTTCSAAGCPPGCSARSASCAASPTPSTRSGCRSPRPERSRSTSAPPRTRPPRCCNWSARNSTASWPTGSPRMNWSAPRATSRAPSPSPWRMPRRG